MTDPQIHDTGLMAVLELLAEQAPAGRFDALLQGARRDGTPGQDLVRLERAVHLARGVQAWQGQRRQREDGLADLVDTARDLTSPHDVESLLHVATSRVKRLLNFDMTSIAVLDPEGDLRVAVSNGSTTALVTGHSIPAGYGMATRASSPGRRCGPPTTSTTTRWSTTRAPTTSSGPKACRR